jgi:uncharacterized protein YndB with AHSA1/START domain
MSRTIEKEVFIQASPDAVWSALTEAEELTRWFPVHAKVEGGDGGSIWLSWGEGTEGRAPITSWDPGRRFGWTEARGALKLVVDFHLAPRDGGTVVRLVQSGFGDEASWDDEYHMTEGGWNYFVEHLRWYLERHRGTARALIVRRDAVRLGRAEAFTALVDALGLTSGVAAAAATPRPYEVVAADGQPLAGTVVALKASTGQMGITIADLDDAILFLEMEPAPDGCRAGFWLSTYGLDDDRLATARARFEGLYDRALAAAPAG